MTKITKLWRGSSSRAFEALLREHLPVLHRMAYRFTGDAHEAEDLVQELLLRLYPRRDEVLALDKPRPWMVRVLYRMSIDRWRQRRRDHLRLVELPGDEAAVDLAITDAADEPPAIVERELTARDTAPGLVSRHPLQPVSAAETAHTVASRSGGQCCRTPRPGCRASWPGSVSCRTKKRKASASVEPHAQLHRVSR